MQKRLMLLLCMLLITTILVAAAGAYLKYEVLAPLGLFQDAKILTVPFMLLADEPAQYILQEKMKSDREPPTEVPTETPTEAPTAPLETEVATTVPTQPPTEPPTEAPTEPIVITESWFDDALFIGDSRTLGMRATIRLGDADYFCAGSMSTFTALIWKTSDKDFYDKSLQFVLSNFSYNKIFIHLGLNECGYEHELVIEAYQELIDLIREHQPDAAIIVQSVMSVSRIKATEKHFTLERINNLNRMIRELAEENGLYYQDINEFAADEEGYLRDDISNDGCHPHNFGYEEWAQWMLDHCGELGIP